MVKINYKCSSCGGKLSYTENSTSLKCSFCNKNYDEFIKVSELDLSEIDVDHEFNYCYCSNCGMDFSNNSDVEYLKECCACGSELNFSNVFVNGFIRKSFSVERANEIFSKEISGIKKYLPKEFLNPKFELKYLNSRLYDGVVIVKANDAITNRIIERKYVFLI